MSGCINSCTNYQFLDLTKGALRRQLNFIEQPVETPRSRTQSIVNTAQFIGNVVIIVTAPFADLGSQLVITVGRIVGYCLPPLPQPPARAHHDDAEFLQCAVERGLWTWDAAKRKEMQEAIEICDGTILAIVGEFCLAYFYENNDGKKYTPAFLEVSARLKNKESFESIGERFARLNNFDKRNLLQGIYNQQEPKDLSKTAKQVRSDIRALASKMSQGNKGYIEAFQNYQIPDTESTNTSGPQLDPPIASPLTYARVSVYPNLPRSPVPQPQAMPIPSAPPRETQIPHFQQSRPQPSAPPQEEPAPRFARANPVPSAPPGGPDPQAYRSSDTEMAESLVFVRRSLSTGCEDLKRNITSRSAHAYQEDLKGIIARLIVIQALRDNIAQNPTANGILAILKKAHPDFVTRVTQAFLQLSPNQFKQLIQEYAYPKRHLPSEFMHFSSYLDDLAQVLRETNGFDQIFTALKTDLLIP